LARIISGMFFFLLVAATAVSQTFRGGINGIVTDPTGGVVLGARSKQARGHGLSYVTVASSAGEFAFQDLPLGNYTIVVSASGFQTAKIDSVRVSAGAI
jgi:hypothetical protein